MAAVDGSHFMTHVRCSAVHRQMQDCTARCLQSHINCQDQLGTASWQCTLLCYDFAGGPIPMSLVCTGGPEEDHESWLTRT